MSRRRSRKKLSTISVVAEIESLSHDGRGIAHIQNKITFIRDALPGETVEFQYTCKRGSFDEGQTTTILNASPMRAIPPCTHYGICGGCSLQHMQHDQQIRHKQQTLINQLLHFGALQPKELLEAIVGPTIGYRYKARLGVRYVIKKEKVLVGFRERNGQFIADIDSCPVLHSTVGENLTTLSMLIHSLESMQHIPQIEVAAGDEHIALVFRHLQPLPDPDIEKLLHFGKKYAFDIYLQPGNLDTVHKIYPENTNDRLYYDLPHHNLRLYFHPCDFTQVNPAINRTMVDRALALLEPTPNDTILDVFCGLGNFTLPIAKYTHSVVGIEGDMRMVYRGQENAQHNHITNAQFFQADLTQAFTHQAWAKIAYNKMLIDPPRSGALEFIQQIDTKNIQRILYISCNPATLARDAGCLTQQHGFTLQKAGIMDMFPHTSHVESIALFTK